MENNDALTQEAEDTALAISMTEFMVGTWQRLGAGEPAATVFDDIVALSDMECQVLACALTGVVAGLIEVLDPSIEQIREVVARAPRSRTRDTFPLPPSP